MWVPRTRRSRRIRSIRRIRKENNARAPRPTDLNAIALKYFVWQTELDEIGGVWGFLLRHLHVQPETSEENSPGRATPGNFFSFAKVLSCTNIRHRRGQKPTKAKSQTPFCGHKCRLFVVGILGTLGILDILAILVWPRQTTSKFSVFCAFLKLSKFM